MWNDNRMKISELMKRRFVSLVGDGYHQKQEVIEIMKKEFNMDEYEIKLLAREMYQANQNVIDVLELTNPDLMDWSNANQSKIGSNNKNN